MAEVITEIKKAITGQYPIIYLNSAEEQRIIKLLRQLAEKQAGGVPVATWSCTSGLDIEGAAEETKDPVKALQHIIENSKPGFYVMKDLLDFTGQPQLDRLLRDAYEIFCERDDLFIFIISSDKIIPTVLSNEIFQITVGLPDLEEMLAHLQSLQKKNESRKLRDDALKDIALALCGLTLNDATHIMHQINHCEKITNSAVSNLINESKKRLVASGGMTSLEYVPVGFNIDQVGGLGRLKEWISVRKKLFTHKAQQSGMPIPRGILIMGISGCGKSLCAKVVAKTWNVPLFRLDMNLIFSQLHGSPEAAFHKVTQTVESAAPAVLWIDEIENGLGLLEGGNINQSHVFSAFLTWMQEKSPLVFVAATANQIESLPAELIRKGRFDQIFFCDLPDDEERAEILKIHLKTNKQNPDDFDIKHLTKITKEWNAAEIEQAVNGGRIDASSQGHKFSTADIAKHADTIVPLSETMKEQIKKIKDWAWDRATPASKGKGRELSFGEEN
ncbi:AAA family ATPase [Pseudomonadota bacterium]